LSYKIRVNLILKLPVLNGFNSATYSRDSKSNILILPSFVEQSNLF